MNALNHSKFNLSIADLIKADADYYGSLNGRDSDGSPFHELIMEHRCTTLAEVREKLCWMTEGGTGLTGEEDAFKMMLEDLDRLMTQ